MGGGDSKAAPEHGEAEAVASPPPAAAVAASDVKPSDKKAAEDAAPAEKAASPKTSPKKQPSPKASPKAAPKEAPKAEVKDPASPSSKLPVPPGEVTAEGAGNEDKKGRGKGKRDKTGRGPKDQPAAAPAGNKLCVKNLPDDTTAESLKAMFASYGGVSEADAKVKEDGKCRGFGFVTMSTVDEAAKAISSLNGKEVGDKKLVVVIADKREQKEDHGKGKGKDKGVGKGVEKGAGKGKDGKGKGKGVAGALTPQSSSTPQAGGYNPYTNAAYMQAYYQQYNPYVQQYYNAYGIGYAQQQYMNQQYAQYAAASASAQPSGQAYQTPQISNYTGNLKPGEYEGSLKSISEKHGYGFIACEDTFKKYGRDVYVNQDSLPPGAKVLDRIRFTVKLLEKEKKGSTEKRPTAEHVTIVPTTGTSFSLSS